MTTIGNASHIEKLDEINRLRAINAEMQKTLEAAYTYISQPRRMTQTEATYDIRNYNALTTKIRKALGRE